MGMTIDADRFKELLSESRERLAGNISDKVISIIKENYIHKADYENRLKADMVAILTELQLEIDEKATEICDDGWWLTYNEIIQQKIDKLKEAE